MSHRVLLRRGNVVDPSQQIDEVADVRIRSGVIEAIGQLEPEVGERVLEVENLAVIPGLIDVHVHLREPGQEWKETIGTGTAAAAAGGFTTVFCMPNTEPALDSVAVLAELERRAAQDAAVRLRVIAAITEARRGNREVDFDALAQAGAVGYSDDGQSTADSAIMVRALEASRRNGIPVMVHCEDPALARGAMHDGDVSRCLGFAGIPAAAEEIFIERDLALARLTGGWLHVCHVSTARGADGIDAGRREGVNVTAEVTPHHLLMDDEWVAGSRSFVRRGLSERKPGVAGHADTKVNPPLRRRGDAEGLLNALKTGKIELVATDHAPHAEAEKSGKSFHGAAFGLTGSELAVPLMLELVRGGYLEFSEVVRALSCVPARLWKLGTGTLRPGSAADIAVIDVNESWVVSPDRVYSRGLNTPLLGAELRGRVKLTLVGGDERHRDW